jgi:hypothetical protein
MSILKSAGFTAIPWICATISGLTVGGWLIDHLIARGYDETIVRKTVLVLGMLLGLAVFGATVTTDPAWAIVWISLALSGLAAASPVGWSIPSLAARACARPLTAPSTMTLLDQPNQPVRHQLPDPPFSMERARSRSPAGYRPATFTS